MAHEKGARMVGNNPSLPSQFGHLKGMTSGCCGGAGLLSAGCLLCSLSPVLRGHGAHTHTSGRSRVSVMKSSRWV